MVVHEVLLGSCSSSRACLWLPAPPLMFSLLPCLFYVLADTLIYQNVNFQLSNNITGHAGPFRIYLPSRQLHWADQLINQHTPYPYIARSSSPLASWRICSARQQSDAGCSIWMWWRSHSLQQHTTRCCSWGMSYHRHVGHWSVRPYIDRGSDLSGGGAAVGCLLVI